MRKPGAFHHARFMSKSLYILKIAMFKDQFTLTNRGRLDIVSLAEFIALIYGPYFLQSALAIDAPRNDRDLWVNMLSYQVFFFTSFVISVQDIPVLLIKYKNKLQMIIMVIIFVSNYHLYHL